MDIRLPPKADLRFVCWDGAYVSDGQKHANW